MIIIMILLLLIMVTTTTTNNNNKHLFIILYVYNFIYLFIIYPYTIIRDVRPSTCNIRNAFVHLRYGSKVFLSTIPYPHLKVKVTDLEVYSYKISFPNESFSSTVSHISPMKIQRRLGVRVVYTRFS